MIERCQREGRHQVKVFIKKDILEQKAASEQNGE